LGRLPRKRRSHDMVPVGVEFSFAFRKKRFRRDDSQAESDRPSPVLGGAGRGGGLAALAARLRCEFAILREGSFRGRNALTALARDLALFLGAHRREAAFRCRPCARHCMPPWAVDLIATSTAYLPKSSAEKRAASARGFSGMRERRSIFCMPIKLCSARPAFDGIRRLGFIN
jgi:hypothetical protein